MNNLGGGGAGYCCFGQGEISSYEQRVQKCRGREKSMKKCEGARKVVYYVSAWFAILGSLANIDY